METNNNNTDNNIHLKDRHSDMTPTKSQNVVPTPLPSFTSSPQNMAGSSANQHRRFRGVVGVWVYVLLFIHSFIHRLWRYRMKEEIYC